VIAQDFIQNRPVQQRAIDIDMADTPSASVLSAELEYGSFASLTRTVTSGWEPAGARHDIFATGTFLKDSYRIDGLLGQGGMGQVYAARDCKRERSVAIKAAWEEKDVDTLRNEARVLSSFRHPGIVAFHALEREGDDTYMVMEQVAGTSLQAEMNIWTASGEQPMDEIVDCLVGICEALETLHASGFAHRDIKPQNIVMSECGRPVLVDFGLAMHRDEVEGELPMAGSPHYIAPETIESSIRPEQLHLLDIYALGVMAFEMISGRPPFRHCVLRKILEMHLHEPAPRLSQYVDSVPEELAELIASMMDKHPENRPQSASEVISRLRAVCSH